MNSSRSIRFGAFVASALAFSLAAGGFAQAASTATVSAKDASGWTPITVSIDPGGTVTWQNQDTNNPHTVQCDESSSNAPCPWSGAPNMPKRASSISPPSTTSITFPKAGTFAYYCSIHPNMTGTVVVGSGHPAPSSTPSSTPRHSTSAQPTTHASVTPTKSASVAPSASKSKGATKPGSTPRATSKTSQLPLAAGKTGAKNGPSAGVAVPAAILISLIAAAHVVLARARRRSA